MTGQRDLAVLFALATPLGISAWGFARGGHHEAALVLLCGVLTVLTTMVLVLNSRGVHDVAITAYGGIILTGALLLSRRMFYVLVGLVLGAATIAFGVDIAGLSSARLGRHTDWMQYAQFLVITGVFAALGRFSSEKLMGSVGDAQRASVGDVVTGLLNRAGFVAHGMQSLRQPYDGKSTMLVLADIDKFRRVNMVIGHRAGDGVLQETARRLSAAAGAHVHARIGDDEFAVLATGLSTDAECEQLARAIHAALQFEFLGVSVRTSVGFARSPRDANGMEALMLAAEGSLLQAKDHEHETDRFAAPADRI